MIFFNFTSFWSFYYSKKLHFLIKLSDSGLCFQYFHNNFLLLDKESTFNPVTNTCSTYGTTTCWSILFRQLHKPAVLWETWVRSLGWEDPLEKGMATHSSILAWRIPRTAQSTGSQSVTHELSNFHFDFHKNLGLTAWIPWNLAWAHSTCRSWCFPNLLGIKVNNSITRGSGQPGFLIGCTAG